MNLNIIKKELNDKNNEDLFNDLDKNKEKRNLYYYDFIFSIISLSFLIFIVLYNFLNYFGITPLNFLPLILYAITVIIYFIICLNNYYKIRNKTFIFLSILFILIILDGFLMILMDYLIIFANHKFIYIPPFLTIGLRYSYQDKTLNFIYCHLNFSLIYSLIFSILFIIKYRKSKKTY